VGVDGGASDQLEDEVDSPASGGFAHLSREVAPFQADLFDTQGSELLQTVAVTAGASAPESLVREVLARLREWGATQVRELDGEPEDVTFALPKELRLRVVA